MAAGFSNLEQREEFAFYGETHFMEGMAEDFCNVSLIPMDEAKFGIRWTSKHGFFFKDLLDHL